MHELRSKKKKNELTHHGIKGQKWGVRRFQNADGSLTAAGQKRYAKQEGYKSAVKAYNKQYNKASAMEDKAEAEWSKAKELYLKTEKNKVSRVLNVIGNKSAAVKAYNEQGLKAAKLSDAADAEWEKTWELHAKTGKTAVTRWINTIKYSS